MWIDYSCGGDYTCAFTTITEPCIIDDNFPTDGATTWCEYPFVFYFVIGNYFYRKHVKGVKRNR